MLSPSQLRSELSQFIGTEHYHYVPGYTWLVYTDGVKHFFEKGGERGAYWLVEWFGSFLKSLRKHNSFMDIYITVDSDNVFTMRVTDGNDNELFARKGSHTDLQYGQWKFFMQNGVVMLPSEY